MNVQVVGCPVDGLRVVDLDGTDPMCGECRVLCSCGQPLGHGAPPDTREAHMPDQPPDALAELHAAENGHLVVAVASYELASALTGDPIMVSTLDGVQVLLRLLTVDEALAQHAAAVEALPPGVRPPLMSRARAAELVAPLRPGRFAAYDGMTPR